MGYDLKSVHTKDTWFRFNIHSWGHVLNIASDYGWQPMGTYIRKDYEWEGGYRSNDGQIVRKQDALNLAYALEKVLLVLPRERTSPNRVVYMNFETMLQNRTMEEIKRAEITGHNERVRIYGADYGELLPDDTLVMTLDEYRESDQTPDILLCDGYQDLEEDAIDYLSGEGWRSRIQEFIEFCRLGSFRIY